jgi:hypothetical protein
MADGKHIHDATASNTRDAVQYMYWYVVVAEISYGRTVGHISKFTPYYWRK